MTSPDVAAAMEAAALDIHVNDRPSNVLHIGVPLAHVEEAITLGAKAGVGLTRDSTHDTTPTTTSALWMTVTVARWWHQSGWNEWSEPVGEGGNDNVTAHLVGEVESVGHAIRVLNSIMSIFAGESPTFTLARIENPLAPGLKGNTDAYPFAAVTDASDYGVNVYEIATVEGKIEAFPLDWTIEPEGEPEDEAGIARCAGCGRDVMDEEADPNLKDVCVDCAESGLEPEEDFEEQSGDWAYHIEVKGSDAATDEFWKRVREAEKWTGVVLNIVDAVPIS